MLLPTYADAGCRCRRRRLWPCSLTVWSSAGCVGPTLVIALVMLSDVTPPVRTSLDGRPSPTGAARTGPEGICQTGALQLDLVVGEAPRSFSQSFHHAARGTTGGHQLDDPPDLTCKEHMRQYAVDDPLLSCKQQVPPRSDWLVAEAN